MSVNVCMDISMKNCSHQRNTKNWVSNASLHFTKARPSWSLPNRTKQQGKTSYRSLSQFSQKIHLTKKQLMLKINKFLKRLSSSQRCTTVGHKLSLHFVKATMHWQTSRITKLHRSTISMPCLEFHLWKKSLRNTMIQEQQNLYFCALQKIITVQFKRLHSGF